eukprot:gene17814-23424_t
MSHFVTNNTLSGVDIGCEFSTSYFTTPHVSFPMCIGQTNQDLKNGMSIINLISSRGYLPTCRVMHLMLWMASQVEDGSLARDTFLDIGANIGSCSVHIASLGFPVIAVEPVQQHVDTIRGSASINPYFHLEVHHLGISGQEKLIRVNFGHGARNWGASEFHEVDNNSTFELELPLKTVDQVIGHRRMSLVKIDCEGCEWDALKGAKKSIRRIPMFKIELVQNEYTSGNETVSPHHIIEFLHNNNFDLYIDHWNEQSLYFETAIEKIQPQISLFSDILYDLETGYVDNISPSKLFETAVTAMLKTLDPYTEYENFGQARSMQESVSGKYGGVGLVIANSKDSTTKKIIDKNQNFNKFDETNAVRVPDIINGVSVADAFEGYAYDAGMRIGDRIISVNDVDTRNMNVEQVRDLLRGDPYTYVKVKFERDEGLSPNTADSTTNPKTSILDATLKRNLVKISDVRLATFLGDPNDGIGYINLSGFNAASAKDFRTAFLMLRFSSPQDLKSLILDLRGNPGGLLDAAIEIASYLVPAKSNIVTSKSKDGTEITYRSTIDPIRPPGMKLAVLVNGGSASAAEIVAGAIQDLDAGVIVGSSKTYGKGLVQKVAPLPYDSALKYTVARYYTPSGRCIQATTYSGGRDDYKTIINDGAEEVGQFVTVEALNLISQYPILNQVYQRHYYYLKGFSLTT